MIKPVAVDLPYPDMCDVTVSRKNALCLSPAYAAPHGELNAVLQYTYHHFNFDIVSKEVSDTLMGIAITEMRHFDILGTLLLKLGADPVMTVFPPYIGDFYTTASVSYSKTPQKMLLDDITGEMKAIMLYKKILEGLTDETVSACVSRIILDEELHVKVLKSLLEKYTGCRK